MAVSPARRAAYDVVRRVFEQGAYADRALRPALEHLEDPRDRALAKRLAYGTVQRKGTLDWVISRLAKGHLEHSVRAALRLGLYEVLFSDGTAPHAAVDAAVELAKPSPGHRVVNAVLRRALRDGVELPDDVHPAGAAVRHSHPEWIVRLWWDTLGADETRLLLAANNEPAEVALRVNTLVPTPADLPPGLREGDALVLDGPLDLAGSELFREGVLTPQSRGAQRVALAVDPQPGERVLDLCAAPGGKTTHLAALMGDEGTVVAVERHRGRAEALRGTAHRLHATCVEVVRADARELVADAPFDRVLVDPPCSGLGTLRSHPDLRWRMTPEQLPELVAAQDALLTAARAALKPGGRLVYSTCTINPAEERLLDADHVEQTLPHRDGTDGFHIARVSSRHGV